MSEIISIHVGGCGAKVGLKYWAQLTKNVNDDK